MSEPTVSTAAPPKKKPPKKLLGLPVPVVVGGVAALAALGYIWWRDRHKTSAASSSSATSTASQDLTAELAELQSELDQLTGQGSSSTGTGVGGGGGGGGVGSTGSSTGTGVGTTTSTSTATGTKLAANPVKNLRITDDGYTSLTGEWDKSANATSYLITVLQDGKVLKTQHAVGDTARVGNLKRKTKYEFRVRAQPGGKGGSDAHVDATTK